jgi:dolichol-phosphate mannosyltransferase
LTERELPQAISVAFKPRTADVAVVICVWNEGDRLRNQLRRMSPYLGLVDIIISDRPSNDGSTDRSTLRTAGVTASVELKEAGGFSASLRAGLGLALDEGYGGVLMMDGNDKDDVGRIPEFIHALASGVDYAQGSRYIGEARGVRTPRMRDFLIRRVHVPLFSLLAGHRFTDTTNGMRGFSASFLCDPRVRPFRHRFGAYELPYYLGWAACRYGFRVAEIPASRVYPPGRTPTKIRGVERNWQMLKPLVDLALRRY